VSPIVLPDEGTQDLHHSRLVPLRGVLGEPFQGVDAAQAHVEVVAAQLLDGLGVAIGDVTLLGHLEGASGDPVQPAIEPERQQGTYANQPGQECRAGVGNRLELCILRIFTPARMAVQQWRYQPPDQDEQHSQADPPSPLP
jgi:hypothetical protein